MLVSSEPIIDALITDDWCELSCNQVKELSTLYSDYKLDFMTFERVNKTTIKLISSWRVDNRG